VSRPSQNDAKEVSGEAAKAVNGPVRDSGSRSREHFIPVRKAELIRLLANDARVHEEEPHQFDQLCTLLAATIHYRYHSRLEDLKELYAPFNPDSVTRELQRPNDDQRQRLVPVLFDKFTELLQRANYRRLSRNEIDQAVGVASDWGVRLQVDFEVFDRLEVYVRGEAVERRTRRSWQTYYRVVEVDVPLYQRLVVVFHLRNNKELPAGIDVNPVHIKVFKNIPRQDLDMLLPGTRFAMTLLDRGMIILPTLTGIGIAILKIVKGALLLAFAGAYGILGILGLVGGTVGYGVKSFLGYLRTKEKYQLNLTRSLYYQNLDNNAGAIFRVLDEAEEQEFCEAILAYALLLWRADQQGWTSRQLDMQAEDYLSDILGRDVDFEVRDALAKLERFGCAAETADGHWRATPLKEALLSLDRAWDSYFQHHDPNADLPDGK
jgi:hypothetical protein